MSPPPVRSAPDSGRLAAVPADSDVDDYLAHVRRRHPWLAGLVDSERLAGVRRQLARHRNEFDDDTDGRGGSYRTAQRDRLARSVGITSLLRLAGCGAGARRTVLDVFGGDGLVADVWASLGDPSDRIVTADISETMIRHAARRGLPAVRQSAQRMVLRSGALDAVLMAYGTHHLSAAGRRAALAEARRTLLPGGLLVVHDFDERSAMATWFARVVHPRSRAGHPYRHFTVAGLQGALSGAGFTDIRIRELYDPFRIRRPTADWAAEALVRHLRAMYGLIHLPPGQAGQNWVRRQAESIFTLDTGRVPVDGVPGLTVRPDGDGFVAELPRMALVAVARRSPIGGER